MKLCVCAECNTHADNCIVPTTIFSKVCKSLKCDVSFRSDYSSIKSYMLYNFIIYIFS